GGGGRVVGGGPPVAGATLDYLVHVTNTSAKPVTPVVITDNLNAAGPGALTYVAGSASMNGSPKGVSVAGNVITANYSATYGPLAPGGTIDLRFRATLGSTLAAGTVVTNTGVVTWNTPPQTASASVSVTIGAVPGLAITKQVSVVGGGAAVPGGQLDYLVHVTNNSATPVNPTVITDNLNAAGAGALTYVAGSASMN